MAGTRRTDGLCPPPSNVDRFNKTLNTCIQSGHESVRLFRYSNGKFDRAERAFVGFGTVIETDMDGNEIEVTHSQVPGVTGKVLRREIYLGPARVGSTKGVVLRRHDADWRSIESPLDSDRRQIYLAQSSVIDYARGPDNPSQDLCSVSVNQVPDNYGRVEVSCSRSCTASAIIAGTSYSCDTPVEGLERVSTSWADPIGVSMVRERPREIQLTGIRNGTQELISQSRFRYDGTTPGVPLPLGQVSNGWVTETSQYLDVSVTQYVGGFFVITERREYDAFGNVIKSYDANGKAVTSTFNPTLFSLYRTSTSYTNDNNITAVATYVTNLAFGSVTSTTSANNDTTQTQYDTLGRAVCEAQPGDSLAGCFSAGAFTATKEREFIFADPTSSDYELRHHQMIERTVEPNSPDGYLETITYVDGLGRPRFRKVHRVIGSDAPTTTRLVIEGQTDYDAEGRPIRQYGPYLAPTYVASPSSGFIQTAYGPFNGMTFSGGAPVMDPLGRPRTIDPPDQTLVTHFYQGSVHRSANAGGGESWEIRDSKERVVETKSLDGSTQAMKVNYQFDAGGRETWRQVSDVAGTTITTDYDSMGRVIQVVDPDAGGTWTYGYDYLGNLLYANDPKVGQHTQTVYDDMSRPVRTCHYDSDSYVGTATVSTCSTGGTLEASFSYDTGAANMIGRLRDVTDQTGSTSFEYDDLGRVTKDSLWIDGHLVAYTRTYDRAGHAKSIQYGFGDVATYGYNAVGHPISLVALQYVGGPVVSDHVDDIDYDMFGRIEKVFYANGVVDTKAYYGSSEGYRIQSVLTEKADGTDHLNLTYGYSGNALGKIGSISDSRNSTGPLTRNASFSYDSIGRLINVSGSAADGSYGYDGIGNLTVNRGQSLVYSPSAGTAGPHHVDSFGGLAVTYDANGNRQSKARTGGGIESYTYDRFNRLVRIDVTGIGAEVVQFRYNHAGRKVTKQVGTSPRSRYFGDLIEKSYEPRPAGGYNEIWTKHFFIAGMRVSSARQDNGAMSPSAAPYAPLFISKEIILGLGVLTAILVVVGAPGREGIRVPVFLRRRLARVGSGALLVLWIQVPAATLAPGVANAGGGGPPPNPVLYYHADHLGSTQVVTDGSGSIYVQLRNDPYGKEIIRADAGGAPIAPSNKVKHEFTGHEREHVTGLIDAGARFLDGDLAQFLTMDPAGQYASPYAYGPGDPINGTDPDGTWFQLFLLWAAATLYAANLAYAVVNLTLAIIDGDIGMIGGALATFFGAAFAAATFAAGVTVGMFTGATALQANATLNALGTTNAALSAYSTVQGIRGREVHWAVGVAQMLTSIVTLAYARGTSEAANGEIGLQKWNATEEDPLSEIEPLTVEELASPVARAERLAEAARVARELNPQANVQTHDSVGLVDTSSGTYSEHPSVDAAAIAAGSDPNKVIVSGYVLPGRKGFLGFFSRPEEIHIFQNATLGGTYKILLGNGDSVVRAFTGMEFARFTGAHEAGHSLGWSGVNANRFAIEEGYLP